MNNKTFFQTDLHTQSPVFPTRPDVFSPEELGSRMSAGFIRIQSGSTVRQAMRALIDQAAEVDSLSTLFVVEEDDLLTGVIELKALIAAREDTPLSQIITTTYPFVHAHARIEDELERLKACSEEPIPVLDEGGRLLGVLTAQELARLAEEEMEEDYARLAGLSAEEDLHESLRQSVGKRLPWLIILLGLGLMVSGVVGAFEAVVARLAIAVSFQSLILDMAGNAGTQSLAVTIRVLTDEPLDKKQKRTLLRKEAQVGLANGLLLGALCFMLVGLYLLLVKGQAPALAFSLSACAGGALAVSLLLSSMTGTAVPLLFQALKVDPAVTSGPLITTLNDLVAVIAYYGLVWLLLLRIPAV